MAELFRWSGNDTSKYSLFTGEFEEIVEFAEKYSKLYLFGNGRIGSAMKKFLEDSGYPDVEILTSADFDCIKELGKPEQAGLIVGLSDQYFPEVMGEIREAFPNERICIPSALAREEIGDIFSESLNEEKFWINIYVTNKCNLGCKSCSAFAPICKTPDFYELEQFKKDIAQIKKLDFRKIRAFEFTGAEAMLHPDILEMLSYARELFPDLKFQLYSNGLFIEHCDEFVLRKLAELKVVLTVTEYPIPNLDLSKAYQRLDECGVQYYVIFADGQKYFSKRPLNFTKDTPKHKFIYCPRYKTFRSLFLNRGRLYKCIYCISANYVNEAFDQNLEVFPEDYVDIYNATKEDVYRYATRRIPFCGYCSPIEEMVPWGLSERKIEEWT